MRRIGVIVSLTFVAIFFSLANSVDANEWSVEDTEINNGVFIPDDEYIGYFDSNGIFTVVGAIKNTEHYSVTPTITVNIQDGEKIISLTPKDDKTILKTVWDIKLTGMMGMFTGMVKKHIKGGTEQAMQSIKEEIER